MKQTTYLNKIGDYSIELPFQLNSQQIDALKRIDEFIHDPFYRTITLSGWAGTGKTTLMEIVRKRYNYTGPTLQFAATTHKAAAVLKSKIGTDVSTVNSLFGIMIETDMDKDTFDVSKKKRVNEEHKLIRGSLVIIDEASMISEENYKDVIDTCVKYNCKVIFIGDSAQLSPVNENDISIVFRDDEINNNVIELTHVERTNDVPILNEATRVRMEGHLSYETNLNGQGGVEYITGPEQLNNVIDDYIGGLKDDPNYFRILTYTNKNVNNLNTIIRKKLGYDGLLPQPGEPLMGYSNWKYIGRNRYEFINSESYTVVETVDEEDKELCNIIDDYDGDLKLHITNIKIKNPLGKKQIIPYIDIKNNKESIPGIELVCRKKIQLWREYKNIDKSTIYGKITCKNILLQINALDDLLFVNDNVYDAYGNLLQQKMVDFGYVHTIHKSQGSTFENVLINDIDIDNHCKDKKTRQQLRYVGVTRAKNKVMILTNIKNS